MNSLRKINEHTKTMVIQPVILAGGSGTRLWPLSREQFPKQLLKLTGGEHSLLQATALRLDGVTAAGGQLARPLIIGNEEYRFLIAQQMQEIAVAHAPIILEPCGRNTAPALTLAALAAQADGGDPVLVVMPSDHVMLDRAAFCDAVLNGVELAAQGRVVTFGITPNCPETGYGYIQCGQPLAGEYGGACAIERFVEKPDLATAESYLADGNYLWNAGIFVVQASVWLQRIEQFRPDIAAACARAHAGATVDRDFLRPESAAFAACPSDSIDYAVMEPLTQPGGESGRAVVVPLAAGWSDVGAWSALWEIGDKNEDGNVLFGDTITVDTHNTLVFGESRLIACVGLDNAIVIETSDAILVADKRQIQKVKEVVAHLKREQRSEGYSHRKVHRPWGWYDSVDNGSRFQVKRIVVNPGASLSLQMHHHRAEHWIVVSGTARVTRGSETLLVTENQSTYIPLGELHRLENPGCMPLEMIEVQSGSYLGEDDIVRFADDYGRSDMSESK
jgi:mannose-1-phosphate guanylyltransferase / mannose-6-phosphate isomerase